MADGLVEAGVDLLARGYAARLLDAGFTDAYRAIYPDTVAKPAFTWSPVRSMARRKAAASTSSSASKVARALKGPSAVA